ncbi:MAG: transglutaminaseTgpA domain-containing protein [Gaiellaceae bacterium]
MRRALPAVALAAPLLAWSWLRLEDGRDAGPATLVVLLALLPLLAPGRRLRAAAALLALFVAGALAFDLGPSWALPGQVPGRFGDGFLEFYDVQIPFDPATHPRMHGVLLLALFAFTLTVALAAAACRPGVVALALIVGVGWPGTLLPGHDLLRGGMLLLAVLATTALLRRGPVRGVGVTAAAAAVIVAVALFAASSPALAKRAFLDWQHWDPYTKPAKPIDVSYVWDSSYRTLRFHGKPTTVFRVKAGPQPHYWRSSVLNAVTDGRWSEELSPEYGDPEPIGEPGLIPPRETQSDRWEHQVVTIEALRDHRLPGGSVPVSYHSGGSVGTVQYDPSGVAYAGDALSRGETYQVWSYSPTPTPRQLARSKPVYSGPIVETRKYREVQPGVYPQLFGRPRRVEDLNYLFTGFARADQLRPFQTLYRRALQVAGGARSPYAAAVALEQWFRFGGGFVYDQHPPTPPPGVPALEDFVARTKRGYCQHFAGAMALMLRYLGIPSRVAVGFASGRYDGKRREWVVSDRDAHMWVEVWFRGWGWLPFDPTPGRGGLAGRYSASSPSFDISATAAVLAGSEGLPKFRTIAAALGFGDKPRTSPDVPELGATQSVGLNAPHHRRDWGILRLLLFGIAGAVVALTAVKLLLRALRFVTRDPRRLATACRKELRDFLLDQGLEIPQSATLRELAALVEDEFRVEARAFGLHATAARFGPRRSAGEAARAMRRDLRGVRRGLRRELTRGERLRGLLSLRSLGLA